MKPSRHRLVSTAMLVAGFSAVAVCWGSYAQAEDGVALTVQGSTTFNDRILEPNLAEIEASSGSKLSVVPNKSIWGLIALLERRSDLAMISADLNGEIAAAKLAAPALPFEQLKQFEIARARVAFINHPSNPVRKLTLAQAKKILLGEITNWRDVGGPDLAIRVVATQNGGGTVIAVRGQLLDGAEIGGGNAIRLESARHVLKVVEQEPGAFGIAQRGLSLKSAVTILETDAPVEQVLSFVTLGEPSGPTKAVIDAAKAVTARSPL